MDKICCCRVTFGAIFIASDTAFESTAEWERSRCRYREFWLVGVDRTASTTANNSNKVHCFFYSGTAIDDIRTIKHLTQFFQSTCLSRFSLYLVIPFSSFFQTNFSIYKPFKYLIMRRSFLWIVFQFECFFIKLSSSFWC